MFGGVTYGFFIVNAVVTMELFLISRSFWVAGVALMLHLFATIACRREPRIFELWLLRARQAPRLRNYAYWRCNSYSP